MHVSWCILFQKPVMPKPVEPPVPSPAEPPKGTSDVSSAVSSASKKVEDLEKELELDLENMKIDENIDTSVSNVDIGSVAYLFGFWKFSFFRENARNNVNGL